MVSNAFYNSIKIISVKKPFLNPIIILSVICPRQMLVDGFFENQIEICGEFSFCLKMF